jgi:hypothetical protein
MTDIHDIIRSLPPMEVDEQTNVFHCKEGRGNDRLYIKRTVDGYLFNCFHCGKSGGIRAASVEGERVTVRPTRHKTRPVPTGARLPADVTGEWGSWHPRARGLVVRYITKQEVADHGLLYSPSLRRVVLPVYDSLGLVGYQTRKLFDDDGGGKYLTFTRRPQDFHMVCDGSERNTTVVIVEDALSAIKCSRYVASAALFGVSLKDSMLARLARRYANYLIFLDDDNAQVKMAALKIKRRLTMFGDCAIISGVGCDPKECDDDTLKGLIT